MISARRGAFAVLGAAVLFGTSGTSVQLVAPDAPPASVAGWRLVIGALGLVAVVCVTSGAGSLVSVWRRPLTLAMGACVAGYQALFFIGTSNTGVAVGTLVSLGVAPFIAGLLGWALKEGPPGWVWVGSTVAAVAGLALLLAGSAGSLNAAGGLAALGAGGCYAAYTVLGVRLARDGHPSMAVLAAAFSIGAVLLLPSLLRSDWWQSPSGIAEVLWLGLVTTTAGYVLFSLGLRVLQPGHIATLTLLEPAVATILGVLVLHEVISATGWLGCALIVGALALLGVGESRRRSAAEVVV